MTDLDVSLLAGFEYRCLPGCGLCCFTSPRVDPEEERRLRAARPEGRFATLDGQRRAVARPDGGACQFLSHLRCDVHSARPAPCREFPLLVHLGERLQATLVLSCPGVGLDSLGRFPPSGPVGPGTGLESELAAARARITSEVERRQNEGLRRRRTVMRALRAEGRWVDDEALRRGLWARDLVPTDRDFTPQSPPSTDEPLELLPMYFDGRNGPVGLAAGLGGWELRELREGGGSESVAVEVPPDRVPSLDPPARDLLAGYLRYWVARDGFIAAAQLDALELEEVSLEAVALRHLHAIASDVLARGSVRAKRAGGDGRRLSVAAVAAGIRATDQDWLDRPTWGGRL